MEETTAPIADTGRTPVQIPSVYIRPRPEWSSENESEVRRPRQKQPFLAFIIISTFIGAALGITELTDRFLPFSYFGSATVSPNGNPVGPQQPLDGRGGWTPTTEFYPAGNSRPTAHASEHANPFYAAE